MGSLKVDSKRRAPLVVSGRAAGGQTLQPKSLHSEMGIQQPSPQIAATLERQWRERWARLWEAIAKSLRRNPSSEGVTGTAGSRGRLSSWSGSTPLACRLVTFTVSWGNCVEMENSVLFQSTNKQECRVESDTNPTVYGCLLKFSMGFVYNLTEFQHCDKLVSKT